MNEFRHIAVEGAPGAGKTAVAEVLARRMGAEVITDVEENPFLPAFHKEMTSAAFQTQIWFLLSRYQRQERLRQPDLFQFNVVTDFLFDRDEIYASLTLSEDEKALYQELYRLLGSRQPVPDLVVYLQMSAPEAIRRGRDTSRGGAGIEPAFMKLLVEAYEEYFFSWNRSPLIVVKADDFDPAGIDEDREELWRVIQSYRDHAAAGSPLYFTPRRAR
jgi:deoxyadenosine/deoxycytidine kinase